MKAAILLVISVGLFWFAEGFPWARVFEPESIPWKLWASYAKDLILPFALYFFLCLGERWLKTWQARALVAFAIPMVLELGQAFYYLLPTDHRYVGSFDPLDIVMYVLGVGLAVIVEQAVFTKLLRFDKESL
jgi:hypothetical protein